MPNVKIYLDESIAAQKKGQLADCLPLLREVVCRRLEVDASLCQFAIITVCGIADQAQLSVEILLLSKPGRTRERILSACGELTDTLIETVQIKAPVRVTTVDAANYVVIR